MTLQPFPWPPFPPIYGMLLLLRQTTATSLRSRDPITPPRSLSLLSCKRRIQSTIEFFPYRSKPLLRVSSSILRIIPSMSPSVRRGSKRCQAIRPWHHMATSSARNHSESIHRVSPPLTACHVPDLCLAEPLGSHLSRPSTNGPSRRDHPVSSNDHRFPHETNMDERSSRRTRWRRSGEGDAWFSSRCSSFIGLWLGILSLHRPFLSFHRLGLTSKQHAAYVQDELSIRCVSSPSACVV